MTYSKPYSKARKWDDRASYLRQVESIKALGQIWVEALKTEIIAQQGEVYEIDFKNEPVEEISLNLSIVNLIQVLTQFLDEFLDSYIKLLERIPSEINSGFVLNSGMRRVLHEWDTINRLCEQHVLGLKYNQDFGTNLERAALQLQAYRDRWRGNEFDAPYIKLGQPIPYFEKRYKISRSLYLPDVPLIAIPLTDYGDATRWQALAHEFGHHIYWNGVVLGELQPLHHRLQAAMKESVKVPERTEIWVSWIEEVFSDIVGTLLAGPNYVMASQDIIMDRIEDLDDLRMDDGEHPCPYLRPLICLEVLKIMVSEGSAEFQKAMQSENQLINQLEERWQNFSGAEETDTLLGTDITMNVLKKDAELVVHNMLRKHVWPAPDGQSKKKPLWDLIDSYGQADAGEDVGTLIDLVPSLKHTRSPYTITNNSITNIPSPFDVDISPTMKQILDNVTKLVEQELADDETYLSKSEEEQKEEKHLRIWAKLAQLELSETDNFHTHYWGGFHQHCKKHWHLGSLHIHTVDGLGNRSGPINC